MTGDMVSCRPSVPRIACALCPNPDKVSPKTNGFVLSICSLPGYPGRAQRAGDSPRSPCEFGIFLMAQLSLPLDKERGIGENILKVRGIAQIPPTIRPPLPRSRSGPPSCVSRWTKRPSKRSELRGHPATPMRTSRQSLSDSFSFSGRGE